MAAHIPPGFPSFELPSAGFGQWWRVHGYRTSGSAWWFSSVDYPQGREPAEIGRFDLPHPHGTCYVAAFGESAAPESLRESGVSPKQSQEDWNKRRISQMSLDRWYGQRIADFTSSAVTWFGAPSDVASLDRKDARPWAAGAQAAGFSGILYRLREDPTHRVGMALFGSHGDHPTPGQPPPVEIPTRMRNEVLDLFGGQHRGEQVI